jgi:hypothetical protein
MGAGLLDAARIVALGDDDLTPRIEATGAARRDGERLQIDFDKHGVVDMRRALAVVYNGDPRTTPADDAPRDNPWKLGTLQLGHAVFAPPGRPGTVRVPVEVDADTARRARELWVQAGPLDAGLNACDTRRIHVDEGA